MTRPTTLLVVTSLLSLTAVARADEHEHEPAEHGEHEHSPFEIRVGVEAPMFEHASEGSTNITKEFEGELDVMGSYVVIPHTLSIDLELGEAVLLSSDVDKDTPTRRGTVVRPGVGYSPSHELPIYLAAMLPIHLEKAPVVLGFRAGVGVDFHLPFAKLFVEADLDLPLAGGSGAPDAFKTQTLSLATGLLFHLPK